MKILLSILLLVCSINAWAAVVGEVAMLRGGASIVRDGKTIAAKVQLPIMEQDLINTHKNGKLQLIFKDNTVITLGANSSFSIADYLFDEQNSRANFSVSSGSFKVITGRIGKLAPKSFLLKTKTSLIGIRGTIFAGDVGVNNGDLLACLKGSISVQSLINNSKVIIDHGNMVFVDNAGKLGNVQQIDNKVLPKLNAVQAQPSQDDHQQEVVDIDSDSSKTKQLKKIDKKLDNSGSSITTTIPTAKPGARPNINQNIIDKKAVNYRGTLAGTSKAEIRDSKAPANNLDLDAKIDAVMDMRVDFGKKDPLKIKLSKQKINFTEVKENGVTVDPTAYNAISSTLDMNLDANMELHNQKIDVDSRKITANSSSALHGLNKTLKMDGKFVDASAREMKGKIEETANGKFGSNDKTIDREIKADFHVKQHN